MVAVKYMLKYITSSLLTKYSVYRRFLLDTAVGMYNSLVNGGDIITVISI